MIDISPLAVEVCRRQGVRDARIRSVTQVDRSLGTFDTIVMFGNNVGLLGGRRRARWLLRRFRALTSERGRILATTRDTYATDRPEHLAYHERNRASGRLPGQLRLRVRHGRYATPWFDYLIVSRDELERLLPGTGWELREVIDEGEPLYAAILERE